MRGARSRLLAMLTSLLLVALSLQAAADPRAGQPVQLPPVEAPTIPQATQQPAQAKPAALMLTPEQIEAERFKRHAIDNFWSMNFHMLNAEHWTFIGMYYGAQALLAIILMALAWTFSGWASIAVRSALGRIKFDETLSIFLAKFLRWTILLLGAMASLSYFGIQTTGFAAIIGAAGLAIGLAFQGTLSNFAAGAMLLIFRPYKVGDSVVVAGNSGTVAEIELFTTALDTSDNRRVIIPNSSIYGTVIENHSSNMLRRAEVLVGVAYSADIDETRAALNRAVTVVTLLDPAKKSEVALLNLGASSVDWAVRGWAKRDVLGDAKQALIRAVKMELDRAGIGIPFPQLDIHFDPPPADEGRRAA
jgi:small conductance mechanosensitive channel